jgi:hypothetical protein
MNPPPEATYNDVDALKATCRHQAAAHLYSVTTERSDYKMDVLLLHCGKSGTRDKGGGGGWEKQISRVGGSAPKIKFKPFSLTMKIQSINILKYKKS